MRSTQPSARQPSSSSASPEAKLFYYRPPARRIPSPTNILSIDRRDEEGEADVYAAQLPRRRPTNNTSTTTRRFPKDRQENEEDVADVDEEGYFFFDPGWTRDSQQSAPAASPRPMVHTSSAVDSSRSSTVPQRGGHPAASTRPSKLTKSRGHADTSAAVPVTPLTNSTQLSRHSRASATSADEEASKEKMRHLKHLLRRYQRYVEEELEPELTKLQQQLNDTESECAQLRSDNVILTQQLQRVQNVAATSKTQRREMSDSGVGNSAPALPDVTSAMPSPVVVTQDAQRSSSETHSTLQEATAEVRLLKRQLSSLRKQYDQLTQQIGEGSVLSPLRTAATVTNGGKTADAAAAATTPPHSFLASNSVTVVESAETVEAARAACVKTCVALSEDGLGFTEALAEFHEHNASLAARDLAPSSPAPSRNPYKDAVEAWRRYAKAVTVVFSPHSTSAPRHSTTLSPNVSSASDVFNACTSLLTTLAQALQTEHSAVAAGIEAAQQAERISVEAVARHQRVVEQVRKEAERRVQELEADHDVEVQTLENAIAELEQQVSVTAASKRPWTAGLFIHRRVDNPVMSSPTSSNARGSHEGGGSSRRDAATSRGGGGADTFDASRPRDTRTTAGEAHAGSRADGETQTLLSLEWIQACLLKAKEEPMRAMRREKEAELVELMATEIETLRRQLMDSRAVTSRLREEQRRFLGDVTLPLSYFDNFSSFPAYV